MFCYTRILVSFVDVCDHIFEEFILKYSYVFVTDPFTCKMKVLKIWTFIMTTE